MHLSSAAAVLVLSSLGASYVLPFVHSNNLMRRNTPYAVVNVDGDNDQSSSTPPETKTTVQTVTASSPPPPPVTVTVTSTPSSTPITSPCLPSSTSVSSSGPVSSNAPVASLKAPSSSSIGTFLTILIPKPSGMVSSMPGQKWEPSSTAKPQIPRARSLSSITGSSSIAARGLPSSTAISRSAAAASKSTGIN